MVEEAVNRQFVGAGLHVLAAVVWTTTTFATSHGVYSVMVGLHAWFALHYCRQYHLNRPSVSSRPPFTALCAHHGERIPVTLADGTTVAWICKACDGTVYSAEYAMAQDVTGPWPAEGVALWPPKEPPRYRVTDRRRVVLPPPPPKASRGGPVQAKNVVIGERGRELVLPTRAPLGSELRDGGRS